MLSLTRELRIALTSDTHFSPVTNSWSGWPTTDFLVPFLLIRVTVSGSVSPVSGMTINVSAIDSIVRKVAADTLPKTPHPYTAMQLLDMISTELMAVALPCGTIKCIEIAPSPYTWYSVTREYPSMYTVTRQFEFAASHRLHSNQLSDTENTELFGKCNRLNGHGHNYLCDVTVRLPLNDTVFSLRVLDEYVRENVIDVIDHTYLNLDVPYFSSTNPTVENIARFIWSLLDERLPCGRLVRIRVYENLRTWADYSAVRD